MRGVFDWPTLHQQKNALDQQAESPSLWDQPQQAQKVLQERARLQETMDQFCHYQKSVADLQDLIQLATQEDDPEWREACEQDLMRLEKAIHRYRLSVLMSGEVDQNPCFLEIHAGAGGTEAQDWAQMLLRMYLRWAGQRGFKTEMIDETPGEEAGIKSVTCKIVGPQAYGWLKTESGVHRLVRVSPFDANGRRHTSFASVAVYPEVDATISITIEEKDLRTDTYRASGAGGQHVNKTESAIRITHLPTGVVVQCQNDRSQHRNRAQAMDMLRARLYELERRKQEAQHQALNDAKTDIGWGHQIRSYVLQPYQMIKDSRTGVETSQTQMVLDGDIDDFLEAALIYTSQNH